MPEQIDRNHWNAEPIGIVIFKYIIGVGILSAEILPETQSFGFEPRFLKLNQHKFQAAVVLPDFSSEVYAEHRYFITTAVGVFVLSHLHLSHFAF